MSVAIQPSTRSQPKIKLTITTTLSVDSVTFVNRWKFALSLPMSSRSRSEDSASSVTAWSSPASAQNARPAPARPQSKSIAHSSAKPLIDINSARFKSSNSRPSCRIKPALSSLAIVRIIVDTVAPQKLAISALVQRCSGATPFR